MFPKGFYPFDKGILNNLKEVFCHGNKIKEWPLPTLMQAKQESSKHFNWCENEYYSCC